MEYPPIMEWPWYAIFFASLGLLLQLAAVAVIALYTKFTFNMFGEIKKQTSEIKKQTDLATDAFLKIKVIKWEHKRETFEHSPQDDSYDNKELHSFWEEAVGHNIEWNLSALPEEQIWLDMSNLGKSEITGIQIKYNINIKSKYTTVRDRNESIIVDITCELSPECSLYIPLLETRYFPEYDFDVYVIKYYDLKNKKYEEERAYLSNRIITGYKELLDPETDVPNGVPVDVPDEVPDDADEF